MGCSRTANSVAIFARMTMICMHQQDNKAKSSHYHHNCMRFCSEVARHLFRDQSLAEGDVVLGDPPYGHVPLAANGRYIVFDRS